MAFEWIKMRADLLAHPKVVRISSQLSCDTFRTIGGLLATWSIFDVHSEDGVLPGYTPAALDNAIHWPGFAAALLSVDWLEDTGQALVLPEFDTHNSQSAKKRAVDTERQRYHRLSLKKRDKRVTDSGQDADENRDQSKRENVLPTDVGNTGTTSRRRKSKPVDNLEALMPDVPLQVLTAWKKLRDKKRAPITDIVVEEFQREASKAGVTLEAAIRKCCGMGWQGLEAEWLVKELKKDGGGALPWWASEAGIIAKGRDMGLEARPGELLHDFKGRVSEKIGK